MTRKFLHLCFDSAYLSEFLNDGVYDERIYNDVGNAYGSSAKSNKEEARKDLVDYCEEFINKIIHRIAELIIDNKWLLKQYEELEYTNDNDALVKLIAIVEKSEDNDHNEWLLEQMKNAKKLYNAFVELKAIVEKSDDIEKDIQDIYATGVWIRYMKEGDEDGENYPFYEIYEPED